MDKYNVDTLITTASENRPLDFQDALHSILADKINIAIANKKTEIAQNLYKKEEESEEGSDE